MSDEPDGKRLDVGSPVKTAIAIAAFLLGGYLAYTAYAVYRAMPHAETGTMVDYTEHLIVIGNVGIHPLVLVAAIAVAAAVFVAIGVSLTVAGRE